MKFKSCATMIDEKIPAAHTILEKRFRHFDLCIVDYKIDFNPFAIIFQYFHLSNRSKVFSAKDQNG